MRQIGPAAVVERALEGEQHQLEARPAGCTEAVDQVAHALDVGPVDAALLFLVHAARVEKEQPPCVLAGIEKALAPGVNVDTARRVAGAEQVRVAVPDVAGVETFPSGPHELVLGEIAGKLRQAGIPHALLWPEPARGEGAGACEGARSQEELPTQASSLCSP